MMECALAGGPCPKPTRFSFLILFSRLYVLKYKWNTGCYIGRDLVIRRLSVMTNTSLPQLLKGVFYKTPIHKVKHECSGPFIYQIITGISINRIIIIIIYPRLLSMEMPKPTRVDFPTSHVTS